MPRQSRIDAYGALQHVIARGIARQSIFWDDRDRLQFLDRLGTILQETGTRCFAWALIPNHFHLLLKTGEQSLSTVMRRLLTGYAVSFNRRHHRRGHLFQNRFKSILCQEESYLLELTRYIHLNPLRAKIVNSLEELDRHHFAGHSVLMGSNRNDWQDTGYILRLFGKRLPEARRDYRRFVEKGISQGRRPELTGGGLVRSAGGWSGLKTLRKAKLYMKGDERMLGNGDFVQQSLQTANERLERKYRCQSRGCNLDQLARRVAQLLDISIDDVFALGKTRSRVRARSLLCYFAVRQCGMTMVSLSRQLGISQMAVSQSVKRGEKIALENRFELDQP
jgi:REP element-mobilizing transposase RayT